MAALSFNAALQRILPGDDIRLKVDTIKLMLVNASVTPTGDETSMSTFTSAEINVTNYTPGFGGSGRATLSAANMAFIVDHANNYAIWDYTQDILFSNLGSGATIRAGIIYKHTGGSDANSIPISYVQLASDVATNGGNFTFQFNTVGIFRIALL